MHALTDEATSWVTIAEAAARSQVTPFAIRSRIKRGNLRTRKDNRGRVLVAVPASSDRVHDLTNQCTSDLVHDLASDRTHGGNGHAELQVQLARVEAERDVLISIHARELATLEAVVADLRRDRETLQATIDRLVGELAETRRPLLLRIIEVLRRK
jgi:hypothetical protein